MKIQKSQLKALIKGIVNEAVTNEIFGFGDKQPRITPAQEKVAKLLASRSFKFIKYVPGEQGVDIIMERPYGKGRHPGNRIARIQHDGTINNDKIDVNQFLQVVGESLGGKWLKPGQLEKQTPNQKKVVDYLERRGFNVASTFPLEDEQIAVVLDKSSGKFGHSMAEVHPDGSVNGQKLQDFLNIHEMIANKDVEPDVYGAVNVGENLSKGGNNIGFKPLGQYNKHPVQEEEGDESKFRGKFVDRGSIKLTSGVPQDLADKIANQHWDIFGSDNRGGVWHYKTRGNAYCCAVGMYQGKPTLLSKTTDPFRNELLVGEEEIFPKVSEQTGTGAVAGYATPFAFSKRNKDGSKRALDVTTKMGYKKVKSISEETK